MEAANFCVCKALLISLCLGLCNGNRAGLMAQQTTTSTSMHEGGGAASSSGGIIGEDKHDSSPQPLKLVPIGVDGVYCHADGCDNHIIVPDPRNFILGCEQLTGYNQCQWRMNDVDTISEYIRGIQAKLDETCWRQIPIGSVKKDANANAMPPN